MSNSTKKARPRKSACKKPAKPYPEFPLFFHNLGYISKRVNRTILHFGRWARVKKGVLTPLPFEESWRSALANFKARIDDLHANSTAGTVIDADPNANDCLTVGHLCNVFLTSKERKVASGEIAQKTFTEYKKTTDFLISHFGRHRAVDGLKPVDFGSLRAKMSAKFGPVRLGNEVMRCRGVFIFATKNVLTEKAVNFGSEFDRPSKLVMRKHRAARGSKMLESHEIRLLIDSASTQQQAMLFLAINCGLGNADVTRLPFTALDLERGWLDFTRVKTGVARRCPLWAETVESLNAAIADRPEPQNEPAEALVFLSYKGVSLMSPGGVSQAVTHSMCRLFKTVGVHRPGVAFYSLRHAHRTASDGAKDQPASRLIMGHADGGIDDVYRERIEDSRLVAVTDFVHRWLFAEGGDDGGQCADTSTDDSHRADTEPVKADAPNVETVSDNGAPPTLRLFAGSEDVA